MAKKQKDDAQTEDGSAAAARCDEAIVQNANLYVRVRKGLTTSLGAMALTADEMREFIDRLVERGEMAESDMHMLLDDLRTRGHAQEERIQQQRPQSRHKASDALDEGLNAILTRFSLARQSEIQALHQQIADISAKIEMLSARRAQRPKANDSGTPAVEAQTPAADLRPGA